jgi:hypothetical protein
MDLSAYRNSEPEKRRVASLMGMLPAQLGTALDIGSRDGFLSKLLADRIASVTALDLEMPRIDDARITCVQGDATALAFADASIDLILCAEVLEHIPTAVLAKACAEMGRVSRGYILVGVPYRQDTRAGRMTCLKCGARNPPYGHVNTFDERRLGELFGNYRAVRTEYIDKTRERTNFVSALLMDLAGNPYGTYSQEEPCVNCGAKLLPPPARSILQRVMMKGAVMLDAAQAALTSDRANWIHVLFEKRRDGRQ